MQTSFVRSSDDEPIFWIIISLFMSQSLMVNNIKLSRSEFHSVERKMRGELTRSGPCHFMTQNKEDSNCSNKFYSSSPMKWIINWNIWVSKEFFLYRICSREYYLFIIRRSRYLHSRVYFAIRFYRFNTNISSLTKVWQFLRHDEIANIFTRFNWIFITKIGLLCLFW